MSDEDPYKNLPEWCKPNPPTLGGNGQLSKKNLQDHILAKLLEDPTVWWSSYNLMEEFRKYWRNADHYSAMQYSVRLGYLHRIGILEKKYDTAARVSKSGKGCPFYRIAQSDPHTPDSVMDITTAS